MTDLPVPCYIFPPLLPSSASSGFCGSCGLEPLPAPAAPPLLMRTRVPEMATPAGPMVMKPPEALMVSCRPAAMTTFIPGFQVDLHASLVGVVHAGFLLEVL